MGPRRRGLGKGGIVLLLCLIIAFASAAPAQERASKRGGTMLSNVDIFTQPQLLNADTNPTLRYPIGSLVGALCSSMAYGWLDISHTGIHFKVVQPLKRLNEGFDLRAGEISDIKIWQQSIRFRSGPKKYTVFYASEDRWESIHNCPGFWDVASLGQRGTASIQEALSNFDSVLAQVKAATAPPPPVVAPPVVNPAVTAPEPKPTPSAPPAVLLIAPSGAGSNPVVDANESPLTIRGFAMDATGIPVVKINGAPANLRPQSNQAAEFWSEPLPLQPGGNPMEIIASNAAHAETKVVFVVRYTPKPAPVAPKGLSKEEIISLLHGEVPSARVAQLVRERGIKFSPADADLNQIRAEGGTDELIQAIQQAAAHP
jgi:hypothetical protein